MNPLQHNFDILHSMILKGIIDNSSNEKIDIAIEQELPNLISAYNKICKALGYKVEHTIRHDILFPEKEEIDYGIEDTDHA